MHFWKKNEGGEGRLGLGTNIFVSPSALFPYWEERKFVQGRKGKEKLGKRLRGGVTEAEIEPGEFFLLFFFWGGKRE